MIEKHVQIIPIFNDKIHNKNNNTTFIHRRMPNLIWQPVVRMERCQVVRHDLLNKDPRTTLNFT